MRALLVLAVIMSIALIASAESNKHHQALRNHHAADAPADTKSGSTTPAPADDKSAATPTPAAAPAAKAKPAAKKPASAATPLFIGLTLAAIQLLL